MESAIKQKLQVASLNIYKSNILKFTTLFLWISYASRGGCDSAAAYIFHFTHYFCELIWKSFVNI